MAWEAKHAAKTLCKNAMPIPWRWLLKLLHKICWAQNGDHANSEHGINLWVTAQVKKILAHRNRLRFLYTPCEYAVVIWRWCQHIFGCDQAFTQSPNKYVNIPKMNGQLTANHFECDELTHTNVWLNVESVRYDHQNWKFPIGFHLSLWISLQLWIALQSFL